MLNDYNWLQVIILILWIILIDELDFKKKNPMNMGDVHDFLEEVKEKFLERFLVINNFSHLLINLIYSDFCWILICEGRKFKK